MNESLTPEQLAKLIIYYRYLSVSVLDEYTQGTIDGFKEALRILDIKLPEVGA
jgi:hypothetical protein